jgi:hypothetical protein
MVRHRGKVKIQYIMDRKERKRTLQKRLPGLLKKTGEFAVLCNAPTSLVVYPPGADQPVTWPSPEGAAEVLRRYKEMGDSKKLKNNLDGAQFIEKLMDKKNMELATVQRQIKDMEIKLLVGDFCAGRREGFDDQSPEVHAALEWMLEKKRLAINERLQELRGGAGLPPLPPQLVQVPEDMPPPQMMAPPPLLQDDFSGLPTTEELEAVFMNAGMFTAPQPGPSFNDTM